MIIQNDFNAENELRSELLEGERFIWTGRPQTGIKFNSGDIFLIPFSIMWCGFAVFWESSVLTSNAPFFFCIWGVPFVLVGLYFVVGRFFYDKMNRERTVYAITPNRIIIKSGAFSKTVETFNIRTLSNLSIIEKDNGVGTIKLDSESYFFSAFNIPGMPTRNKKVPALEYIQNVRPVYNLILQQQHNN
jgi:hypothetical protein